jgi:hypothetical protein
VLLDSARVLSTSEMRAITSAAAADAMDDTVRAAA